MGGFLLLPHTVSFHFGCVIKANGEPMKQYVAVTLFFFLSIRTSAQQPIINAV